MSYERLARALLEGRQYYGPAFRSLQGLPERHRYLRPVVEAAARLRGGHPLQVLEIGSWAGASAVSLAAAVKALPTSGRVLCVDAWRPYLDLEVNREPHYAEMNAAAKDGDALRLFLHNIQAAGVADMVDYRVGSSRDVLERLEPVSFDVIYVDGSHALDDVLCDLSHAIRLVRDGGVVSGDDLELQRDAIDRADHEAALATGRDFVRAGSAGANYHPGVTEAVARLLGPVFSSNGFWAARRKGSSWEWLEIQPGPMPDHIVAALDESVHDASIDASLPKAPELVGETSTYNLVRLGTRYVAAAKSLGPVDLGSERVGDRELSPVLLVGESLEDVRSRAEAHEPSPEEVELLGETAAYNLVRLGTRYVAAAKSLGPVDLGSERVGDRELSPVLLVGESLEDVRSRAEACEPPPLDIELIDRSPDYNLVRSGSRYLGIARTLGPVSIGQERIGERELPPYILISPTLEELRTRVASREQQPG